MININPLTKRECNMTTEPQKESSQIRRELNSPAKEFTRLLCSELVKRWCAQQPSGDVVPVIPELNDPHKQKPS